MKYHERDNFSELAFVDGADDLIRKQISFSGMRFRAKLLRDYERRAGEYREDIANALMEYDDDPNRLCYVIEEVVRERIRMISYDEYADLMDFQMSTDVKELKEIFGADLDEGQYRKFQESIVLLTQPDFFRKPYVPQPANSRGLYQRHRPRGASRNQLQRWDRINRASPSERWEVFSRHNDMQEQKEDKRLIEPGAPMRNKDEWIRSGTKAKVKKLLGLDGTARYRFQDGSSGDPQSFDLHIPFSFRR